MLMCMEYRKAVMTIAENTAQVLDVLHKCRTCTQCYSIKECQEKDYWP